MGDSQKQAVVIGANGYLGSHIARQLVAAGRPVRAMVRASSDTRALDGLELDICHGDVLDRDSLVEAMTGCRTVFYCVVDTRAWLSDSAPLFRVNVDGLVNAMEAALACGVERFLFTSTMATIGSTPGGVSTEETAFNWLDKAPDYVRSRVQAEAAFMRYCAERGLPGLALCVANTYGPQDFQPTPHGQLLWNAARGKLPVALDCSAPVVDIRDAAAAALLAEHHGAPGQRYIIASEFMSQAELYGKAAAQLGRKPPRIMKMKIAYLIAGLNELYAGLTGKKDVQLRRDSVLLSEAFGALDNARARRDLHWQPRPMDETIAASIDWFSQREPIR